jgi:hypothetical protein
MGENAAPQKDVEERPEPGIDSWPLIERCDGLLARARAVSESITERCRGLAGEAGDAKPHPR